MHNSLLPPALTDIMPAGGNGAHTLMWAHVHRGFAVAFVWDMPSAATASMGFLEVI